LFKLIGNKKLFMLLLALIFFVALMGLTLNKREKLTWPEMFIKDSISWTQGLLYKPARYIAGFFEDVHQLRVIYEENKQLKMTLSQYARDTMRLNDMVAQNKRFKDLLDFTDRQKQSDNYKYHVAEVVSESPDPYSNVVNINLGSKDGMKENMAVMSVDGLIGRVTRVSNFYSTVQLLTDIDDANNGVSGKGIAVTVKNNENESFGTIESFDGKEQKLVMTKIVQTDPLKVGDTIVTSGLGQVFPRGIVVGTVVSKLPGDFGINYKALIEPAAKSMLLNASGFRHLREVLVVEVPAEAR
jgi:rod shape-determining protein MreC